MGIIFNKKSESVTVLIKVEMTPFPNNADVVKPFPSSERRPKEINFSAVSAIVAI